MTLTESDDMQLNEFREPREPRKCTRHRWRGVTRTAEHRRIEGNHDCFAMMCEGYLDDEKTWAVMVCSQCGKDYDPIASKRGSNNRKRGNRIQRARIVALGGRNLAGNNPNLDGLGDMFAYESKSGGAFSLRVWRWLTDIPKRGNETGVLIVTEAPGPGHKARSYVVVEYDEWRELHGEIK